MSKHKKILVISDLHFPFAHKNWHGFLTKLKSKYKPDTVICIGDEMDFHSINVSHNIDPDLPSPKDELELGKKDIQKLHKLFPKMVLLESNHGSMVLRRAMAKGMTSSFIKSYNQILEVGNGWEWKEKHEAQKKAEIKERQRLMRIKEQAEEEAYERFKEEQMEQEQKIQSMFVHPRFSK